MSDHELLNLIMKYQLYALDLNLFLDTHPDCKEAQEDYAVISSKLQIAMKDYEKQCTPLINFGQANIVNSKEWVNSPWPWENK